MLKNVKLFLFILPILIVSTGVIIFVYGDLVEDVEDINDSINTSSHWVTPGFNTTNVPSFTVNTTSDNWNITNDYYKYVYKLSNEHLNYTAYFKERSSDVSTHPTAITQNGYIITQAPQDLKLGSTTIGRKKSDPATIINNTVLYTSQYGDGYDLKFTYNLYELKEELIIESLDTLPIGNSGDILQFKNIVKAYNIDNESEGMVSRHDKVNMAQDTTIENTSGVLELIDKDNNTVWWMSSPYAYDSSDNNYNNSIRLNYTVEVNLFGNLIVTVLTPYDWLVNATYPVYIDPTWTSPSSVYNDSGELPGYEATKSIDGNMATYWAYNVDQTHWIIYDIGSSKTVKQLRFNCDDAAGDATIVEIWVDEDTSFAESVWSTGATCPAGASDAWTTINITDTIGRYIKVESKFVFMFGWEFVEINEFQAEVELVSDTSPPTFTQTPSNITLTNQTALEYDINASDETGFDCFAVNDTSNFTINCSGYLINATSLNGVYNLNVTINDTSNNENSTIFWVNATPASSDTCSCPGTDTHWEIDMTDECQILDDCNIGTGVLNFTGASGFANISALVNANKVMGGPPANTILWIHDDPGTFINLTGG